MKKITVTLIFSFIVIAIFGQTKDINTLPKEKINWHNKDLKKDKIAGSSVERLYNEILKDKKPKKTIVVAIIDGGVDINHPDLKSRIWTNTDEIPDNNIDDDKNGFVDDIHGWNFIGNKKGDNLDKTTLEKTRMYAELSKKYEDKTAEQISAKDKDEYNLYLKVKESFETEYNKTLTEYNGIKNFLNNYVFAENIIKQYLGKENFTYKDLKNIKTDDKDLLSIKEFLESLYKNNFKYAELKKYFSHVEDDIKYSLNTDFNPRKDIIGDDLSDFNDTNYGNPDVKGPSPSHGTFGAGIIAAVRNNNIGIQGVADSVKLMVLRVVPDGDEYDKDVANGIRYAVDNGANIINMSFGKDFSPYPHKVWEALKYASDHNVLLVHAAGNESQNTDTVPHYPCQFLQGTDTIQNYLAIGASDMKKNKHLPADFSNYGKETVHLFAPGYNIVSTDPDSSYNVASGTSFSTPLVSGVAALLWSYFPEKSAYEIRDAILKGVTYIGKKKVYRPADYDKKTVKVPFKDLCITGGILNAYNSYKILAGMK